MAAPSLPVYGRVVSQEHWDVFSLGVCTDNLSCLQRKKLILVKYSKNAGVALGQTSVQQEGVIW